MSKKLLLDPLHFDITIRRLCYQLIENHDDFFGAAIIGLQPRGVHVSRRLLHYLSNQLGIKNIRYGELDITFYRDDYRKREMITPNQTRIDFVVEGLKVILVDDVLFTGRTIRAGMDALLDFGRPEKIELLSFVDRRYSRHLPIESNYTGIEIDSMATEKVKVLWKETDGEDSAWLISNE